jgi:hypothetical protein
MIRRDPVETAERGMETADSMTAFAATVAADRDDVRRAPQRDIRRRARQWERTTLQDLTRIYRHGLPA